MNSSNAVVRRSSFAMQSGLAAFAVGLAAFAFTGVASAQDASASASVGAPAMAPAGSSAGTDHGKVVEHLGFTWLGVNGLSIASDEQGGSQVLQAPTVGVRYWMNEGMGLDVGLGLAYRSGSTEGKSGSTTVTTDKPSAFGAIAHIGVPIVLGTPGKHYTFTVIPEANLGYGSSTQKAPSGSNTGDLELSGLLINAGARVGAEIQFGFIGIPELSLQGSVGLALTRTSTSGKRKGVNGGPDVEGTNTDLGLGTTVQSSPWGLFTNSVAAIYYF